MNCVFRITHYKDDSNNCTLINSDKVETSNEKTHLGGFHSTYLKMTIYSLSDSPLCRETKGAHSVCWWVNVLAVVADIKGLAEAANLT